MYKHPIVRDLAWVVSSESLTNKDFSLPEFPLHFYQEFYDTIQPKLLVLDRDSKPIEQFFCNKNDRLLGSYFEWLVYYAFSLHPDWEIIEFQHQIIKNGTTLGELDFVVEHQKENILYHIEVAVKFYLANTSTLNEQTLWYGPNGKDRLDLKFSKLIQHQIPMLQKSKYANKEVHSRTWIKGGLFVPCDADRELSSIPGVIGQWCTFDTFKTLYRGQYKNYTILDKKEWLAGKLDCASGKSAEKKAMYAHFKNENAFAFLLKNQITGALLFIVQNKYHQIITPES